MNKGFTLIELLVVIAIISLLSSVVFSNVNESREKARVATARATIEQLRIATELLLQDTGNWPLGCNAGVVGLNPEAIMQGQQIGLIQRPAVGVADPLGCEWTAEEVALWNGPYMTNIPLDPWGRSYQFDADYWANATCPAFRNGTVINSVGPDGLWYTCDDLNSYLGAI